MSDPVAATTALNFTNDVSIPFVTGIIQGSIYGLLGLGIVLLYKSNRIFNFAQGEFGTVAAFVAIAFAGGSGPLPKLPLGVAVVLGTLAGTATAVLTERLVVRPLFDQSKVTLVVATAGVALFLISLELVFVKSSISAFPPLVAGSAFTVGSLQVLWQQVIIVAVLAALGLLSYVFFTRTRYGTAIIAVSQEPTATSLVGISVSRISLLTWSLAGLLGAVAGVLLAPTTLFTPGFMTLNILIPAFTAAVIGGITSLPGAFVGGLVVGVLQQFAPDLGRLPGVDQVPGLDRLAVFAALLLVLLVRPVGLLGKET